MTTRVWVETGIVAAHYSDSTEALRLEVDEWTEISIYDPRDFLEALADAMPDLFNRVARDYLIERAEVTR